MVHIRHPFFKHFCPNPLFSFCFVTASIFNMFLANLRQNQCFSQRPTQAARRVSGCRALMKELFLQNLGCFQEEVTTEGTKGKTELCCARDKSSLQDKSCSVVGLQCQIMLTASPAHLNPRLFLGCCVVSPNAFPFFPSPVLQQKEMEVSGGRKGTDVGHCSSFYPEQSDVLGTFLLPHFSSLKPHQISV